MGIRCCLAADASARSGFILSPECSSRDSSTRCILINSGNLLDPLQDKLFYLADESAIIRKPFRPFYLQVLIARKSLFDGARMTFRLPIRRIHSEAHAKQDILITRGGKHFGVARKILIAGRSITPQLDLVLQAIRNARGIAVVDPETRILALAE